MYIVGGRILTMAGREIPEGILQIRNGIVPLRYLRLPRQECVKDVPNFPEYQEV